MLLRVLIGAACLAVIAFVGTFFWEKYQAAQAAEEREGFLSFCDLNYRVEANVLRANEAMPPHISQGVARCRAAGVEKGQ